MRRILAALILLLLCAGSASADSPIAPHNWERVVGPYRFVMLYSSDRTPLTSTYPASGLYLANGPAEPLWKMEGYAHEHEIYLSPDGEHLVRMGPWPSTGNFDVLAVAFYRNGNVTKWYRVKDLVKNPGALPQTVSHYTWYEEVTYDPGQERLTVKTIPGITYVFDVVTGEILSPRMPVPGTFGPALLWALGGIAAAAAGGIWYMVRRRRRAQ